MLRMFFSVVVFWGGSPKTDSPQEAFCSSQDSSISEQYISSSAQQPCSHSEADVTTSAQDKSPAAATTGTSQSPLYIDLSQCSTPSPPTQSVESSGLEIYKDDVETVQPKAMITDTIDVP